MIPSRCRLSLALIVGGSLLLAAFGSDEDSDKQDFVAVDFIDIG